MAPKTERAELEILDRATNATVVQLLWRRFPGIVVQGDTLHSQRAFLRHAIDALRARDTEDALEELAEIDEWMGNLLQRYEAALGAAGIELPYPR